MQVDQGEAKISLLPVTWLSLFLGCLEEAAEESVCTCDTKGPFHQGTKTQENLQTQRDGDEGGGGRGGQEKQVSSFTCKLKLRVGLRLFGRVFGKVLILSLSFGRKDFGFHFLKAIYIE